MYEWKPDWFADHGTAGHAFAASVVQEQPSHLTVHSANELCAVPSWSAQSDRVFVDSPNQDAIRTVKVSSPQHWLSLT